jgi:ATP diphosphatase
VAKVKEETGELEREIADGGEQGRLAGELGDLLFSVVNLARKLKVDPELALRESAQRFRERVEGAARSAGEDGLVFESMGLDEQETYYQRAKKEQKR